MFVLICVILVIGVLTFDLPDNSTTIELIGIVDGLFQGQSDTLRAPVFLVKLNDGKIVQVRRTSHLLFRKGKKVRIIEQKTSILKRKIYYFASYIEEKQVTP